MKDPFVAEMQKIRMEHAKQFTFDMHKICEDLRKLEGTLGDRVVTLAPRKKRSAKRP